MQDTDGEPGDSPDDDDIDDNFEFDEVWGWISGDPEFGGSAVLTWALGRFGSNVVTELAGDGRDPTRTSAPLADGGERLEHITDWLREGADWHGELLMLAVELIFATDNRQDFYSTSELTEDDDAWQWQIDLDLSPEEREGFERWLRASGHGLLLDAVLEPTSPAYIERQRRFSADP